MHMGVGRWVAWQVCALCTCTGEAGSEASHTGSVPDHGHPAGFKPGLMSRGAARLRAGASLSQFGAKKDGGKTQQEHRWQLASRCPLLPSWINAARARIHTRHVDQRHARWLAAVTCVVAWSYSRPFGQERRTLCRVPLFTGPVPGSRILLAGGFHRGSMRGVAGVDSPSRTPR